MTDHAIRHSQHTCATEAPNTPTTMFSPASSLSNTGFHAVAVPGLTTERASVCASSGILLAINAQATGPRPTLMPLQTNY